MEKMILGEERRTLCLTPFEVVYHLQQKFQQRVVGIETPVDAPTLFSYHISAMVEELGEVLHADKRWKTHRNTTFNPKEKLDELADVFITTMNLAIFSGIDQKTLLDAVLLKIIENTEKFEKAKAEVADDSNR